MNEQANAYLRTRVMSASPEELRLMLLDGALKFARQGREGLADKDYEQVYEGIHQCQAILLELINSLEPSVDPDLCARLSSLYTFMYRHLMDASTQRDIKMVDEVIGLLEYERETWVLLMEQLTVERQDGEGDGASQPADSGGSSISVSG